MRPTDASYPVREEEIVPTSTLGPVLHPLTDWIYGREIGSPFQGKEAPGSSAGVRLSSSGYLRAFLSYYLNRIAYPIELPTIVQAYYLSQRQHTRELIELDIKEKITIAEVLQDLGALEDKALDGVLFFANDKRVKMNYSLKDNDVIKMCPIIGGG